MRKDLFAHLHTLLKRGEDSIYFSRLAEREPVRALYDLQGNFVAGNSFMTPTQVQALTKAQRKGCIIEHESLGPVYGEVLTARPYLWIFGGGHIAIPLSTMADLLSFKVAVVDDREDFVSEDRFPQADILWAGDFQEAFRELPIRAQDFVVIVTRGHAHDLLCLREALHTKARYLGMIGSKKKVEEIFSRLKGEGFTQEMLQRVHAPIGLPIHAETPGEIALSILAQIVQEKGGDTQNTELEDIVGEIVKKKDDAVWALATLVESKGPTPRKTGARLLLKGDGSIVGTVGGGGGENEVLKMAAKVRQEQRCRLLELDLTGSVAQEEGMICGGRLKVLVEPV